LFKYRLFIGMTGNADGSTILYVGGEIGTDVRNITLKNL